MHGQESPDSIKQGVQCKLERVPFDTTQGSLSEAEGQPLVRVTVTIRVAPVETIKLMDIRLVEGYSPERSRRTILPAAILESAGSLDQLSESGAQMSTALLQMSVSSLQDKILQINCHLKQNLAYKLPRQISHSSSRFSSRRIS